MKINTYNLVRKIHLYIAFSILSFVFMYFVTGFILIHANWFSNANPKVLSKQYSLNVPETTSTEKLSIYLQDKFDIHAKRGEPQKKRDGSIDFGYYKPGTNYTVTVSPDRSLVVLQTKQLSASETMIGFHRMNGYGGGWLYDIYVLMLDLASIATILFALTGLYLWYRLMKKKMWGLILLSASIGYTITVIALFMYR